MSEIFDNGRSGLISTWVAVDVSAADQTLAATAIALRVTGAGNIAFTDPDGNAVTMAFTDFDLLPAKVASIQKIGTTATGVWAGTP